MDFTKYFENNKGIGVLSTADKEGKVDSAVYARPHVLEDGSIAFITHDRLTRKNLLENTFAVYLFIEEGKGYKGKRLYLTKTREEEESELLHSLRRRAYMPEGKEADDSKFLIVFKVDRERPLVGDN